MEMLKMSKWRVRDEKVEEEMRDKKDFQQWSTKIASSLWLLCIGYEKLLYGLKIFIKVFHFNEN